ncbi:hypothetical protein AB838_09250 [Rhodobacteraceae bacterium (ex Bugula neritina AB1)]|nr:hypothetical protein AB838_09250 [Rhodobacteraceae bacterium (ex Bugula neritina AB1)]
MKETLNALGVVVATAVASAGAGFYVGDLLKSNNLILLKVQLEQEKAVNGVDFEELARRQIALGLQVTQRAALEKEIQRSNGIIAQQQSAISGLETEVSKLSENLFEAEREVKRLNELIAEEFSALRNVFVAEDSATVLVPGKIVASISMMSDDTVWLTVTDSATEESIALGERLNLRGEFEGCSLIPLKIRRYPFPSGADVQFVCKK